MSGDATQPLLPADVLREGDRLFDATLWCLGQDVLCPEGNLLLRRGLVRHARPAGVEGQSAYSVVLPGGGRLFLWGFGALCECGEAVFVPRDGFSPRWLECAPAGPAYRACELGTGRPPATEVERREVRRRLAELAAWLAGHEEWVAREVGPDWRRACLESRRRAPLVAAEALAEAWSRLGSRIRSIDSGFNACVAPGSGAVGGHHAGTIASQR
ncbi:hypothetical protein LZ198_20965 [Myxococcus sp. K15C18031901]|uniref:hypothetical protein n=1 Tax=Myxococcus dinghuensis TaxID=2906761 RepID=UPI0020A77F59|nr:hypothetical protein [Myxococcus dinghuensis]MCP3101349.1 hypothetical protein [Myxococcus dinghuensis]